MKLFKWAVIIACSTMLSSPAIADADADKKAKCETQYFIGTGKTSDLSFRMCKKSMVTQTFLQEFVMNCQHGLVTYTLKEKPEARYMQLGADGAPVHCKRG